MFTPIVAFTALSTFPFIVATPTRRATTFCEQLVVSCAASGTQAISDPWSIPACIYGATCFGGSRPVDAFLLAIATERNQPDSAKASLNVPGLTLETFNKISTDKTVITQQNFIDGVFSTLGATNGPFPDVSFVISSFQRVNTWTQFCNGPGIPWRNFADYFKYSATVNSGGCSLTSNVRTITQGTGASYFPQPSFTFTPVPSSSSVVNYFLDNTWNFNSCLFAATCIGGERTVDDLLSILYTTETGNSGYYAPKSVNQPRLSEAQFRRISSNGPYYGLLAISGGPWPANSDVVIVNFRRVQSWTAFCGVDGIPYKNIADYFQYSSTVGSPNAC
ncbi:hypothetical protein CVT25_010386 [Psilocybe cyanescens]|uniref:Heme haloperoxidase family profile domain-containing protein n=1 Tax=Psilocybe cyanescens TaxID=93625 RepID=A0A409XP18_PSICY|nr:hypothetical protein CVT25_010386 [Psilocybe cyanescens]